MADLPYNAWKYHKGYTVSAKGDPDNGVSVGNLKLKRVPQSADPLLKEHLPPHLIYPTRNVQALEEVIDAIYDLDLKHLIDTKTLRPYHAFGFEEFLNWAERRVLTKNAKKYKDFLSKPQSFEVKTKILIKKFVWNHLDFTTHLVCFDNNEKWFECLLTGPKEEVFSHWYIHPDSNYTYIRYHYPSKYEAVGISPKRVKDLLGSTLSDPYLRIDPDEKPVRALTSVPVR